MISKNIDALRIAFTAVILVVGFIAIGIAYQLTLGINESARENVTRTKELVDKFEEVRIQIENARKSANSFFATGSMDFYDTFTINMSSARDSIKDIEQDQSLQEDEREAISLQREALNRLAELTEKSAKTHIEYGLDHSVGLRGNVTNSAATLSEFISITLESQKSNTSTALRLKSSLYQLQSSWLKMLIHEKNYTDRGDEAEFYGLVDNRFEFLESLEGAVLSPVNKETMLNLVDAYFGNVLLLVEARKKILESDIDVKEESDSLSNVSTAILAIVSESAIADAAKTKTQMQALSIVFYIVLIVVLSIMLTAFYFLGRSLSTAMKELRATSFIRAKELEKQEKDNEELSNSVLVLMEAADRLSHQDLTVKVPVSADITGAVSDALNKMTSETAATMTKINTLAKDLEQAAGYVSVQNDKVVNVANSERKVVDDALKSLDKSANTMHEMGELAGECNTLAENASESIVTALDAVENAVSSMMDIRGTVSESEKSIKRLGERSKEIGAIVEIIKDISERTHTLALNAGMQAVAAGDAGRGFSVVADEVQRLAEMARESTTQVTSLVKSIQSESSESMNVMNKAIAQVVEGSERAENAGNKMNVTRQAAEQLASAVERILMQSKSQVQLNNVLRQHAAMLKESTDATEKELVAQAKETNNMSIYLKDLVSSVRIFKLPDTDSSVAS